MPNFVDLGGVGRDCDEVAARRPSRLPKPGAPTSRAVRALVIVSSVVNVLEDTMKRVSSALRSRVASAKSVLSTFEMKRNVMLRWL